VHVRLPNAMQWRARARLLPCPLVIGSCVLLECCNALLFTGATRHAEGLDRAPDQNLERHSADAETKSVVQDVANLRRELASITERAEATPDDVVCYLLRIARQYNITSVANRSISLQSALAAKDLSGKTCAVVSNSGVMKLHRAADKIDAADVVMRFNWAPVKGFEEYVGRKDTVRFVNMHFPKIVHQGLYVPDPNVIYVRTLVGSKGKKSIRLWRQFARERPDLQLFAAEGGSHLESDVSEALHQIFDSSMFEGVRDWPTSGAVGMVLALDLCKQVDAFGMPMVMRTKKGEELAYHYYEEGGHATSNSWHKSFAAEKQLWRYIAQNSEDIESTDEAQIHVPSTCPRN